MFFKKTLEQSARFVVLEHDHPFLHWDLLMQEGDVLKAWRLLDSLEPLKWIPAESLPDHRLMYLDYEGPVSGDRGTVKRLAAGTFLEIGESPDGSKAFDLFEYDAANKAICRDYGSATPQWYFA